MNAELAKDGIAVTTVGIVSGSQDSEDQSAHVSFGTAVDAGFHEAAQRAVHLVEQRERSRFDAGGMVGMARPVAFGELPREPRLDQQPRYTANVGFDWPLRGTPLTVGGNLNYTPVIVIQQIDDQQVRQGRKRVLDAYALWRFGPAASARPAPRPA